MPTRAITLSVQPAEGIGNDALWRACHASWNAVQRAANAAMRVWVALDKATTTVTDKGKTKLLDLPKSASSEAYRAAREASPELPSGCISDICQRVRARYLHDRWAVHVSIQKSVPTFRRPLPLSVRTQDWQLLTGVDDKGRECYFARFAILDMKRDARPTVKLICRTARDARLLHSIATGEYARRTLEILPPGWIRKGAIRAKVVYTKPDGEPRESTKRLLVATGVDRMLTANVQGGDDLMHWNLDWLKSKIVAYEVRRRRTSEDLKHERRVPKSRRRVWREDAGRAAEKHHNRVQTALQQVASQVIGRAVRAGCVCIEFDDTERGWIEQFPWHALRGALKCCAENNGLEIIFTGKAIDNQETETGGCPAEQSGGSPSASTADSKPCARARKGRPM